MKRFHAILMLGTLLSVATGCAKKTAETSDTTAPADSMSASTPSSRTPSARTSSAGAPADAPAAKGESDPNEKPGEAITPAATASGVWQQIDAEQTKLASAISAGSLADVHHHAFAIRDLVAALPHLSPGLASAQSAQLAQGVTEIATEADQLDKAGDAGDLSATQAGSTAMAASLAKLRAITRGVK